jgi:hypothetical protein
MSYQKAIRRRLVAISILLICWLSFAIPTRSQQNENKAQRIPAVRRDTSSRPLRNTSPTISLRGVREKKPVHLNPNVTLNLGPAPADPVLQSPRKDGRGTRSPRRKRRGGRAAARKDLLLGKNIEGMGDGFRGPQGDFIMHVAPADTNGAVGETQFVQWVNDSFTVFNKITGAIEYGPVPGNVLWDSFGGNCEKNNDGDPIVQYDKIARRWVLAQFSVKNGFSQCVAISTSPDATGTYHRYEFGYTAFNDYPKMGVWPDGYYTSFDMFTTDPMTKEDIFVGANVCVFDRNAMLRGAEASQQCFQLGPGYFSLLPSDVDGATSSLVNEDGSPGPSAPPTGTPNFFLAIDSRSKALNIWKFHVDWQNSDNSTLGVGADHRPDISVPVPSFTFACNGSGETCIPQPGRPRAELLDSLGERLMFRLVYRRFSDHDSLVVNHSVDTGMPMSRTGVRWYELRDPNGTPTIFQTGTFAPDNDHRWMGSIAMDKVGNMLLGYSISGRVYPGINYASREASDPPGQLKNETVLWKGTGSQRCTLPNGKCICVTPNGGCDTLTRWGDYSSISVDPTDDCTFWYTTQYQRSNGAYNWHTRIGSMKFKNCK